MRVSFMSSIFRFTREAGPTLHYGLPFLFPQYFPSQYFLHLPSSAPTQ